MYSPELESIAQTIVAPGKGILAADESEKTIGKRFAPYNVENTAENRRSYREMLFRTPGIESYIGGVILNQETLRQDSYDGTPFVDLLEERGIIPGVKVDGGLMEHPLSPREQLTKGRDMVAETLFVAREKGAQFAKWRTVILIDQSENIPTPAIVDTNISDLSVYAAAAQSEGVVPIVEPEVLIDGGHGIEEAKRVGERVVEDLFYRLEDHGVDVSKLLLKPSMIVPGKDSTGFHTLDADVVGEFTIDCYEQTVPEEVPGVVFLSGGLSDEKATEYLNAINCAKPPETKKAYSFSFGRALQDLPLKAWALGNDELAQAYLEHRAKMNSLAVQGEWTADVERDANFLG